MDENVYSELRVAEIDEWQRIVAGITGSVTMLHDDAPFEGRVSRRQFGKTEMVRLSTQRAHSVFREPLGDEADHPRIAVSLQIEGHSYLEQRGREAYLAPGDFVIFSVSEPYRRTFPDGSDTFFIVLPLSGIALPGAVASQLSAVKVDGGRGFGEVVSRFLLGVSQHLHEFNGSAGARAAQSVVDLVATTLMLELDLVVDSREIQHRRLRAAIRSYIGAHYRDPMLNTETIAANFFVSTRHLHNLFKPEGTTVAELIRLERLHSAHRILTDPGSSWMALAQIASESGYANAASFSRAFRAQYGVNPGEIRPAD